jgi:hypothetical protein
LRHHSRIEDAMASDERLGAHRGCDGRRERLDTCMADVSMPGGREWQPLARRAIEYAMAGTSEWAHTADVSRPGAKSGNARRGEQLSMHRGHDHNVGDNCNLSTGTNNPLTNQEMDAEWRARADQVAKRVIVRDNN